MAANDDYANVILTSDPTVADATLANIPIRVCNQNGNDAIKCTDSLEDSFSTQLANVANTANSMSDVNAFLKNQGYLFRTNGMKLKQATSGTDEFCLVKSMQPTTNIQKGLSDNGIVATPTKVVCSTSTNDPSNNHATIVPVKFGNVFGVNLKDPVAHAVNNHVCGVDAQSMQEIRCSDAACSVSELSQGKCPIASGSDPHATFGLIAFHGIKNQPDDDDDDTVGTGMTLLPVDVSVCASSFNTTGSFKTCKNQRVKYENTLTRPQCTVAAPCMQADGSVYITPTS